jgi:hypothetical protein
VSEDKPKYATGGLIKGPRDRSDINLPPRSSVIVEVRVTGGVTIRRELGGTLDKLPALADQAKDAAVRAALAAAASLGAEGSS